MHRARRPTPWVRVPTETSTHRRPTNRAAGWEQRDWAVPGWAAQGWARPDLVRLDLVRLDVVGPELVARDWAAPACRSERTSDARILRDRESTVRYARCVDACADSAVRRASPRHRARTMSAPNSRVPKASVRTSPGPNRAPAACVAAWAVGAATPFRAGRRPVRTSAAPMPVARTLAVRMPVVRRRVLRPRPVLRFRPAVEDRTAHVDRSRDRTAIRAVDR